MSKKISGLSGNGPLEAVSRKSRDLVVLGTEKPVVKLQSASFEKVVFSHVFNMRKAKRIAKFYGLEPQRCEHIKEIVAPEIGPESFGTFEKRAPLLGYSRDFCLTKMASLCLPCPRREFEMIP